LFCISSNKTSKSTVTFIKKTQREFWEAFFHRNISDSRKPIMVKFLTFSYR
jgi:hypothetical protein